ncbi:hypothetical protein EXVG_00325 [Emiliania huxleyi virus 202]|nr:hypothetical protein EXVG_00325 [Emiliania huxleyi virus 202]AHA54224.1 hypothetical protein EhV18_00177 [Emiliania huxleyi virus 18]AHA55252.1 hypothetical protein EhV156_00156 [Emiliania huxleyi virus 156]
MTFCSRVTLCIFILSTVGIYGGTCDDCVTGTSGDCKSSVDVCYQKTGGACPPATYECKDEQSESIPSGTSSCTLSVVVYHTDVAQQNIIDAYVYSGVQYNMYPVYESVGVAKYYLYRYGQSWIINNDLYEDSVTANAKSFGGNADCPYYASDWRLMNGGTFRESDMTVDELSASESDVCGEEWIPSRDYVIATDLEPSDLDRGYTFETNLIFSSLGNKKKNAFRLTGRFDDLSIPKIQLTNDGQILVRYNQLVDNMDDDYIFSNSYVLRTNTEINIKVHFSPPE